MTPPRLPSGADPASRDDPGPHADRALVARLLEGEDVAWARLEAALRVIARNVGTRFRLTHEEIEDLGADIIRKLLEKDAERLRSFAFRCRLEEWLGVICLNLARDRYHEMVRIAERQAREFAYQQAIADTPEHEALLARLAAESDIGYAARDLDAETRRLLIFRFRDGLSYEEIAALLGLGHSAVVSRIRRALQDMALILEARDRNAGELYVEEK